MEVGGIEPQTRVVAQGLTGHCDQIVTVLSKPPSRKCELAKSTRFWWCTQASSTSGSCRQVAQTTSMILLPSAPPELWHHRLP
jgi:hypothetical protein